MKKAFLVVVALAVMVAMAYAAADVRNTKHNLAKQAASVYKSTNYSEVCIFCHTPHAAPAWPLWNRNYTPGTFIMYSTVTFKADASLDETSKLCFSCHQNANTWSATPLLNNSNLLNNAAPTFNHVNMTYNAAIGLNLKDDHPVGFNMQTFNYTKYPEIYSMAQIAANLGDPQADIFPGGMFTCGSCHDVHGKVGTGGTVIPVLLRRSNASSLLCLACHAK